MINNESNIENEYQKARKVLQLGDYKSALEIFETGYNNGNVNCAYGIFICALKSNINLEKSYINLFNNIEKIKSLAKSDSDAAFIIGRCYETGCCLVQDAKLSLKYYKFSAKQGNYDAMFNLGCYYANQNNKKIALKWFLKYSKSGLKDAEEYIQKLNNQ